MTVSDLNLSSGKNFSISSLIKFAKFMFKQISMITESGEDPICKLNDKKVVLSNLFINKHPISINDKILGLFVKNFEKDGSKLENIIKEKINKKIIINNLDIVK